MYCILYMSNIYTDYIPSYHLLAPLAGLSSTEHLQVLASPVMMLVFSLPTLLLEVLRVAGAVL